MEFNPYASYGSWTPRERKPYGIEKKERRICFGYPGYVEEWIPWGDFDTEKERDAEIARLESLYVATSLRFQEYRKVKNNENWMIQI